jgi:hypothetical protein
VTSPLRLYAGAPRTTVVGKPVGPIDPWIGRVVKLLPAEVVAVYLAGRPLALGKAAGVWPLVCLGLVVIVRAFGTMDKRGPQWLSVAVSAVSFVLWVYAMGGRFLTYPADVNIASLALLAWTVLVPVIWRGEPAA